MNFGSDLCAEGWEFRPMIDINWTRMGQLKFTGNQDGQGWLSILF